MSNYQVHMFNCCQTYQNESWCQAYTGIDLKWNDAWLNNKDCDRDGKLEMLCEYDGEGPGHGLPPIKRVLYR